MEDRCLCRAFQGISVSLGQVRSMELSRKPLLFAIFEEALFVFIATALEGMTCRRTLPLIVGEKHLSEAEFYPKI